MKRLTWDPGTDKCQDDDIAPYNIICDVTYEYI